MASPSEKLREESPTKENLNTRRKIAMITAVTIFTFSGGIAGFGSGLINAALNDLPTLASRTSELLRKNICIEDCATYIIAIVAGMTSANNL